MRNFENKSQGLEDKFDQAHLNIESLNKRREILESLEIDSSFLVPLANMLDEINASAAEIMNVKHNIQAANDEIMNPENIDNQIIDLHERRKRRAVFNDVKKVA